MSGDGGPLEEALERLYAASLDEFMALRRELVAQLKGAGDAAAARRVAETSKPTRTAWALNQVARRRPAVVRAVFEAWATASAAQKEGDAAALRETSRAYRDAVAAASKAAREALVDAGMDANAMQLRRMGETLQAACAEDSPARARLLAGRLHEDADQEDPLAGMEGEAAPRERERTGGERGREREREREIAAARKRVEALEKEASKARAAAREAEVRADRARDEADRARRAVGEVERELEAARAGLASRLTP